MDLYVEKQCVDQMKVSEPKKFLMLFEAYFESVYKYVARRVSDLQEAERITKLTFLDASGQIQNTPTDIAYLVWLYSLAKPRVSNYINKATFPKKQGLMEKGPVLPGQEGERIVEKSENMFKKLTMEEAEILRLKFFEELADGDVHFIIGGEDPLIGPKIYRVLKRAHFLLFGESDQRQGVYFGELSGFMERVKDSEKIIIPEAFKLGLKAEISNKFERREFAVNAPVFEEVKKEPNGDNTPWKEINDKEMPEKTGSSDPAKIFVEAVKEMRHEEEARRVSQLEEINKTEKILEIFDKIKGILVLIPVAMFLLVVFFVGKMFLFEGKIDRGITGFCSFDTEFDGDFEEAEMLSIDSNISRKICKEFKPKSIIVEKMETEGMIKVAVDAEEGTLLYNFVQRDGSWRMKRYAKNPNSDTESRKIQRNI
jgi:RNA polymerase sigma-70 factor (ECF subfamily)